MKIGHQEAALRETLPKIPFERKRRPPPLEGLRVIATPEYVPNFVHTVFPAPTAKARFISNTFNPKETIQPKKKNPVMRVLALPVGVASSAQGFLNVESSIIGTSAGISLGAERGEMVDALFGIASQSHIVQTLLISGIALLGLGGYLVRFSLGKRKR
ncbi:MAG: hypothetical protein V4449_03520 [Patescibacteria group bacterium]